jgi:tetratricopeptide (TPR) repeat protein
LVADRIAETQGWIDLEIHHHADNSKPRSQYLPLLKLSTEEDPYNDRNAFYYARELFFYGYYEEAAIEFKRHLSLPKATWNAERAASYRYLAKCQPSEAISWLQLAVNEDALRREAKVELALQYYMIQDWENCYKYSTDATAIESKPLDYLCEHFAWGAMPYDLAAISAYYLDKREEALVYGLKAVELDPNNERMLANLNLYKML